MRRFLSPRWLALHALMVLAFCACLGMCAWQLTRAQGGNTLSWGYTFEWPVFGLFAVAFWGKLIRDERRRTSTRAEPERPRLTAPVLAGARRPAGDATGESPRSGSDEPERIRRVERAAPVTDTADDPELAAYNAYLAWQNANPHRSRRDYPG